MVMRPISGPVAIEPLQMSRYHCTKGLDSLDQDGDPMKQTLTPTLSCLICHTPRKQTYISVQLWTIRLQSCSGTISSTARKPWPWTLSREIRSVICQWIWAGFQGAHTDILLYQLFTGDCAIVESLDDRAKVSCEEINWKHWYMLSAS